MSWGLEYDELNPKSFWANVIGLILLVIAWIVVVARFWARYHIRSIGADDILILPAQVFFNVFVISMMGVHHYTPGSWPKTIDVAIKGSYYLIAAQSSAAWCVLFFKLSLGVFFLRLCVNKQHRRGLYYLMIFSTIINIFTAIFVIFCCGNPKGYLLRFRFDQCVPRRSLTIISYLQASINAVIDILLVTIPFLLLRGSKLPKNMKFYAYAILSLATVGCVASIIRVVYVHALFNFDDFYRSVPSLIIATHVELATGIIASSLATLKPLLKAIVRAMGTFRTSQFYGSSRQYQPPGPTACSDNQVNQNFAKEMNSVKIPRYLGEETEVSYGPPTP